MNKLDKTPVCGEQSSGYQRGRGGGRVKWIKGINCMATDGN